jgi:hypothetical protein
MVYFPPIKKRQYINPIYNSSGQVIIHTCTKCGCQNSAKAKGIWFERADLEGQWRWVCNLCYLKKLVKDAME